MKAIKRTHLIILALCLIPLLTGLVWFIAKYSSLPDPMGIHFGFDEKTRESIFDVVDNKIFGIYPFVAGFGLVGLLSLCGFFVRRVKPSKKVTEKGHSVMQQFVLFIVDAQNIIISIYFTVWTYCIIKQEPKPMRQWGLPLALIWLPLLLLFPISIIVLRIVFSKKRAEKKSN